MSGGPMAALLESGGILLWRLSGVIYEWSPTWEIMFAARADRINDDGTVMC
jgi:hypothetical protein